MMSEVTHRTVATNGIRMHIAETGSGPLVLLCHGFPELWYSWRHQLPALARAGYRAVAPDLRGYGQSSIPPEVAAYDLTSVCEDMLGLLDCLGEEQAVFVGHDCRVAARTRASVARVRRRGHECAVRAARARSARGRAARGFGRGLLHHLVPAAGGG